MKKWIVLLIVVSIAALALAGCQTESEQKSASGVQRVEVKVKTDPTGKTVEQKNVADRLIADNQVGSIKHLYIISAYSGQVIMYSTVKGKVTSSSKRLTPKTTSGYRGEYHGSALPFNLNGETWRTNEVLGDDGTYGSSLPAYLYWWDVQGRYHQHYPSGGQIIHVSDQPINVKSITINLESKHADEVTK